MVIIMIILVVCILLCDTVFLLCEHKITSLAKCISRIQLFYLQVSTLIVDFGKQPIEVTITGKEDGVVLTSLLLELNGYGDQLLMLIDIQQANGSSTILPFSSRKTIHDFQVTDVDMPIL